MYFKLRQEIDKMREKFGLIIHWIGFSIGLVFSLGILWFLTGFATTPLLILLVTLTFAIPFGSCWLIRRVITGYAGFFPWTKEEKK